MIEKKTLRKPCEDCGVATADRDDPSFKDAWLCYHCHCIREHKSPKEALNTFAEAMKLGRLVPAPVPASAEPTPVTLIEMQPSRPKLRGDHVHGCPECYEKVPCSDVCSIEIDLFEEGETPCGAYVVCDACTTKRASSEATDSKDPCASCGHRYQDHRYGYSCYADVDDNPCPCSVYECSEDHDATGKPCPRALWKAIEEYGAATYDSCDEPGVAVRARARIDALIATWQRRESAAPAPCTHPLHERQAIAYADSGGKSELAGWCGRCGALDLSGQWHSPESPRPERAMADWKAIALRPVKARSREDWSEELGPVLWWTFPVEEPPYAGTPLDDDFPEYVTHWTPIIPPEAQ